MRILQIHNLYLEKGGEDAVAFNEFTLLNSKGVEIQKLNFDNADLVGSTVFCNIKNLFFNSNSYQVVRDEIDSVLPDLIHVHNFFYQASPSIFEAARTRNIPVVVTLHNFRLICSGGTLRREGKTCEICLTQMVPFAGIRHKCFQESQSKTALLTALTSYHNVSGYWDRRIHRVIVLTDFLKKKFLNSALRISAEKFAVKPNFVQDYGYSPASQRGNRYLFVGRLSEEKGMPTLIKAFEAIDLPLDIIGTGDFQPEIEALAAKCEHIEYHGFRDKTFILDKLKQCRALIFPSTWYEGMPLTLLESFATGTPTIISNMENLNQMVRDQVDGLFFETGSSESLCAALQEFENIRNESFYQATRDKYLEKYTPQKNFNTLMSIYEEAIEESKAAPRLR
jgi:glycosyltransferase involved in cell wall biosynthesis